MCKALTKLYLAIPCYNEEEVLPDSAQKLLKKYDDLAAAGKITADSRIIFIDDGSKDRTWELIEELHNSDNRFGGIKMSRNRGHQNALLGGLMTLRDKADAVISLDADLQDDIDAIDGMLEKYEEGYDVVYGVRSSREKDSFFKRFTAEGYYKVLDKMGAKIVFNHADFRLMSARALESFSEFHEVNIFLRGLVPMVGYKSTIVEYERKERLAGESKYPLKKMLALALEGITSLSVKPLRFITGLGVMAFMVSVIMLIYFLVRYFTGHTIVGWASLAVSIWALGGLQLLSMGILGEYLGKIYLETKERPRFIISQRTEEKAKTNN